MKQILPGWLLKTCSVTPLFQGGFQPSARDSRQLGVLGLTGALCILLFIFQAALPKPERRMMVPDQKTNQVEGGAPATPGIGVDESVAGAPPSKPAPFEEMLSSVLTIQDPVERERAQAALLERWVKLNPEEALQSVPDLAPAKAQAGLIGNLVQQWAGTDLNAAFAWANALPPGESRTESLRRIAWVWSKSDPMKAADLIADQIPPGPEQTEAAVSVIHQWALQDMAAAKAWAQQFPEGALRERVLAEVAGLEAWPMSSR